jgi:Rieske Fe-S protein
MSPPPFPPPSDPSPTENTSPPEICKEAGASGACNRRHFLQSASTLGMAGALVASYGTLGAMASSFLYPAQETPKTWMFVERIQNIPLGKNIDYKAPSGAGITITRQGEKGVLEDFIALSSRCPHLGCQVYWENQNNRFFCPCHNGVFDATGKAVMGPPADAQQSLPRYPLKIENGLLFIEVPLT